MPLKKLVELVKYKWNSKDEQTKAEREVVLKESKILCHEYIDDRLIRSGLNLKQRKIQPDNSKNKQKGEIDENNNGLKNNKYSTLEDILSSLLDKRSKQCYDFTTEDLSKVTLYVGECLELRHVNVYTDVLNQLNIRTLTDTNLRKVHNQVASELFVDGITWSKVISLFAFAGGLAVDCVLSGSSMHVGRVKIWTVEYIENFLVDWILKEGGWIGLFDHYTMHCLGSTQTSNQNVNKVISIFIMAALVILVMYVVIYFLYH